MESVPMAYVRRFLPVVLAAAALVPSAGASPSVSAQPTLYVNYALNCTFTITGDNGQTVTTIAPGTYGIDITSPLPFAEVDLSNDLGNPNDMTACRSFVQFKLTGPNVNLTSTLSDGDSAFALLQATFQAGTYTAVDENQPSVARDNFSVSSSVAATNPANPSVGGSTSLSKGTTSQDIVGSALLPFRGSLDAIVFAGGKLSLSHNGNVVKTLKTGRWTFSVDDESKKAGFEVQVLHGKAQTITSSGYVGNHDATVTLKPGRWTFFRVGGPKTTFYVTD
jgi:hypothetical protein